MTAMIMLLNIPEADNAWILSKILPASWQEETVWGLWTMLHIQVQEVSVLFVLVLKVCAHQLKVYLHALASLSGLSSMTAMFRWLAFIFTAQIFPSTEHCYRMSLSVVHADSGCHCCVLPALLRQRCQCHKYFVYSDDPWGFRKWSNEVGCVVRTHLHSCMHLQTMCAVLISSVLSSFWTNVL